MLTKPKRTQPAFTGRLKWGSQTVPASFYTGVRRNGSGWLAEVNRKARQGIVFRAQFADRYYQGSALASLRAAHDWFVRTSGEYPPQGGMVQHGGHRREQRGGVYVVEGWACSKGNWYWKAQAEARLQFQGTQRCKTYSIRKHGKPGAIELATEALDQFRQEVA